MSNNNGESKPPLSGYALAAALVALVAFAAFVWYMINRTSANEVTWTRLAWLFSSVEAIAFGAAGALFGSSIQRERAEQAEERANENQDDAANGKALAKLLKAESPGTAQGSKVRQGIAGSRPRDAAASIAARHAAIAEELFPGV